MPTAAAATAAFSFAIRFALAFALALAFVFSTSTLALALGIVVHKGHGLGWRGRTGARVSTSRLSRPPRTIGCFRDIGIPGPDTRRSRPGSFWLGLGFGASAVEGYVEIGLERRILVHQVLDDAAGLNVCLFWMLFG